MNTRYRMINPLLGIYYGIFAAAYVGFFMLVLIGEHMDLPIANYKYVLSGAGFLLSMGIAFAAFTKIRDEFFVAGRRVPAGLNGLILFAVSLGGAGLSGVTGVLFFAGVDGIGLLLGLLGGFILAGVLFAPFVRKSGAFTLSSFLEIRFQSRFIGAFSALLISLMLVFLALGELTLVKQIGPFVFGLNRELVVWLVIGAVCLLVLPGGMRSMSWSQCGLAIVVIFGLVLPLVIISLQYTNLPIAQLTYGSLIDDIGKFQNLQNNVSPTGQSGISAIIDDLPHVIGFSFLDGDRPFSLSNKLTIFIMVLAGLAALPTLLMRSTTTSNVFQVRKSFAWGAALMLLLVLTLPAYSVFFRYLIYDPKNEILSASLPFWVSELSQYGLLAFNDADSNGVISIPELAIARDAIFIGLPMIAGLNLAVQSLCFAALMAAVVVGLSASLTMLAKVLTNDLFPKGSGIDPDIFSNWMILTTRLAIILVGASLGWVAINFEFDAFRLFCSALVISGASLFPVMLLSIWWDRMTIGGAVAGLLVGGGLSVVAILSSHFGKVDTFFGLDLISSGLICLIVAFFSSVIISLVYRANASETAERLMEIRTPGGEAIYDRLLRLSMPRRTTGGV